MATFIDFMAEMLRRRKQEDEQGADKTAAPAASSTPTGQTAFDRWNSFLVGTGVNDNAVTSRVRNWLEPDKQAQVANALGVQHRNLSNPHLHPENTMVKNPYAPGSLQSDMYEAGRTGQGSFKLRSGIDQMNSWDAFVRLGLNDANVAQVAREDAQVKLMNAHARGVEDAPRRYDSYIDRNAGKGYKPFGGNAGDVHEYGLAYENVLAAEATKINRKEGRKDDLETIKTGDYASLSDEYIASMIGKVSDYLAGLDVEVSTGPLYDQEFFQHMSMADLMGTAYAAEDLYEYARSMFPDREWAKEDFGVSGDPNKIAMVTDAVNADIADLRAGRGSKVLTAMDAVSGERMVAQKVLDDLRLEQNNRLILSGLAENYATANSAADWSSMVDVDEKGTDIISKMMYMNLQSQQRDNWDDEENAWLQDIWAEMGGFRGYNDYSSEGYHLMTADEIALVNKVWNTTHDPLKTQEVLDAMASMLRARRMNFDENLWAYRADAYGDLMVDLASIPMQGYANFEGAVNALQGVLGNEDVKDITSGEWRTQNSVNAIRGWTGDKAYNSGGWLGKLAHDWGLAAGDEALKFLPSLVFGPGTQQALSAVAGMAQGTYGAYERGVENPWLALAEGGTAAGIEALTENIGLDVPSTSATRPGKHWLRQIAAEAGEETSSEFLGQIAGEALADLTGTTSANDQAYMDALMASDEKDRVKRHQEAQASVNSKNIQDIAYSGLMGGLVGGTLSAPSSMALGKQQRRTGKAVSRNNNANALLNVAMSMNEGSEARQMGEAFSAQAKKGKKMSNGQLGRLYAATAKDLDAQAAAVVTETMNDVIVEEMVNKGASEETARSAAPILSKQLRGETLTDADRRVLRQSKAATTMLEELNRMTEGGKDGEAVAVEWVDKAVGDSMAKGQSIDEKAKQLRSTLRPSASTAIAKSAQKAKALTAKTATETGVRNTSATPLGSEEAVDIQRVEADKDGVLKLHVKAADGTEKNMSYQQLSFQSESTGHVITHAIDNAGGNAELANLMVQGYTGGDSTEYLAQFDAAYRAGYDGTALNADNMTRYGKGINKEAFKLGQKQAQEAEQTRLKNIGKGMTGNGSVTIPDGVDVKQLSKPQRRQVAVVRTIAKATGINFTFFESTADESGVYRAENGSYEAATNSIRLDLNAGKNYKGDVAEYAILRTAAHEMTHFIEANSRENYAKMRQYIADEFARKGIDFNARVQEKIDRSPVPLTRGGAIAEVVADGCEMMLQDSQAVQRLLQKDESLAGQIKQVLADFADRIRKAFEGIRPGSKDAEALLEERDGLLHYADELVKLWDEGLEEAVETVQGTRMLNEYKGGHETLPVAQDVVDDFVAEYQGKNGVQSQAMELSDARTQFSVRTKEPPKKVGIAYKVFYQKNGKLYPPMVANPGGADTPVGVWLDADIGVSAPPSKTGRLQVKAGGKGTQGGSGSLAFRPGWHLGDMPKATQFDRKNPANGVKELFPKDFVWAECEYAMDVDYQEEAMSYGYTENGKFRHSYAGLPRLPEDGYYHYRTNPNPETVPWVITGAMKVTRILSREDVDTILSKNGVEPTKWQGENGEMELTGIGRNAQYSPRNVQKKRLLTAAEYARLRSDWNDYKYRGYQFIERPNGGVVVDMHHVLVYTDKYGEPEFAIDVQTDDLFDNNDVIQVMMICEEGGVSRESQQELLESYFGTTGARFRNAGERSGAEGEDRERARQDARGMGEGDSGEISSEKVKRSPRTPEFNRWFGNSQVVDADGNPLIVYHGSSSYERFNVFKKGKAGYLGPGIYLTDQEWYAEGYTKRYADSGQMYALYARIENPLRIVGLDPAKEIIEAAYGNRAASVYRKRQASNESETRWVTQADINKLKTMGYDGIIWGTEKSSTREYMVFSPDQIKSATDNVGTFDPQNPDIRYSLRTPAPATTRDYLLSLSDSDLSTAGEKDAMRRYRAYVDDLRDLEEKRAAQEELAQTATGDEKIKAKNRADIYTKQADRLREKLQGMERSNVFRPIMAEARAVLEANRQLNIGMPVETVVKGVGGKVRNAEEKLNRFREKVQQERDSREKITASRRRITKMVKYLDTLRRKESDYKHVPEELKPTVDALVAAFAEHSSMVFNHKQAERLAAAYSKLQDLDSDLAEFYDKDIKARIEFIADLMENNRKKPLTLAQMEIIEDVVSSIYTMVRRGNDVFLAFSEGQGMDIAQITAGVADEMLARQDKTYRVSSKVEDSLNTLIVSGNLTPVYYFDNLGNNMLKRLGYDILNGQDKYGLYQRDDRNTMGEIRKKYNYNAWKNEKPIVFGDVQFTKEQVLWVYATAKREATNELAQTHHLDEGGIVFEGGEVVGADGKKRKVTTPMRLSAKDVEQITSTLTEEQKSYADAVVRHLSTTVGDRGNEVSMRMYGFRKYREQYYFPYQTASDQRHQTSVSNAVSATNDARLKHQSFSNPLKKGANTPLVVGDFTTMATSHMNAMNTYAAMVIPVENMNRVLNRKTEVAGTTTTIRALMAQKYGDPTKRYLETLLKDLNGGVQVDRREGFSGALMSIYKGGAVTGSMSVVLQQWTSIFRAATMVNPKYFVSQSPFFKDEWDQLTKYSGIASVKDMGRFDVGIGRTGSEWVGADADDFTVWQKAKQMVNVRDRKTLATRWDDFFNFLPGWADRVTWAQIWRAVKAEQADQHPGMSTDSEAFMKLCAERFNDVINHTQVYDSVMTRSQLMRGKDTASKMVTAFASEPTLMLNMLYDAAHNPDKKGWKARSQYVAATVTTVMLSQVFSAAMQALASAWRDDDDERTGLEKFLDKFGANMFDNLNPFSMFPLVRDIYTTISGEYEVERGDMEFISELARAIQKAKKGDMNAWQFTEEVIGTVAKIVRVPLKNLMRDMRSVYNTVNSNWSAPAASNASHVFWKNRWGYDTTQGAYYKRLVDAIISGDKKLENDLRVYLTDSMFKEEDTISTGARSYIKDLVQGGEMSLEEAVELIDTHFPYDKGEKYAYKTVLGWLDEVGLEEGEEANTSAYRKMHEAMMAGSNTDYAAAVKELQKYGYKEKDIESATRDYIRTSYKGGEITWEQAEKMYKQFAGITDKDELFWLKEDLDYKGDGNWTEYKPARDALLAGDKKTFLSEKNKLLSHGKEGKNVQASAVTALKDELLALYETDPAEARKLREMIVWAYMECGKTKDSANKIINGWFDSK